MFYYQTQDLGIFKERNTTLFCTFLLLFIPFIRNFYLVYVWSHVDGYLFTLVLRRVKVTFIDTVLRIEHVPENSKTGAALEIRIER